MLTVKDFNHTYLITFKDYDDTVLSSERLVEWKMPTAPSVPPRQGYQFTWWSPSVGVVTQDQIYTATYEEVVSYLSAVLSSTLRNKIDNEIQDKYGQTYTSYSIQSKVDYKSTEPNIQIYFVRTKNSSTKKYDFIFYGIDTTKNSISLFSISEDDCPYSNTEINKAFSNPSNMTDAIWNFVYNNLYPNL